LRVGIIGLPNAGKSTLFNALTKASAATAEYPFTTVEPNVAIVPVPDRRLDEVADALGIERRTPDQIEFVDVAGLVRGAHQGEGLGNRFLGHIREVDAVLHVVRAFEHPQVAHPHGSVDPRNDLEVVETELILADLESAERRLSEATRRAGGGERDARPEADFWLSVVEGLKAGQAAPPEAELLTSKPALVIGNVGEGEALPGDLLERGALAVCALDEAELGELDPEEAAGLRADLGISSDALTQIVGAAYRLLGLVTFFTAVGEEEVRARSIKQGGTAVQAAGKVHTDMERGFARAEVIDWQELIGAGSFAGARELGKLRSEGRDYVVQDGDVVTIRFRNP
jgi:ribosome-binding ATPase